MVLLAVLWVIEDRIMRLHQKQSVVVLGNRNQFRLLSISIAAAAIAEDEYSVNLTDRVSSDANINLAMKEQIE